MSRLIVCGLFTLLFVASATSMAFAQDNKDKPNEKANPREKSESQEEKRTDKEDWARLTGPVEEHKKLDALVGSWILNL